MLSSSIPVHAVPEPLSSPRAKLLVAGGAVVVAFSPGLGASTILPHGDWPTSCVLLNYYWVPQWYPSPPDLLASALWLTAVGTPTWNHRQNWVQPTGRKFVNIFLNSSDLIPALFISKAALWERAWQGTRPKVRATPLAHCQGHVGNSGRYMLTLTKLPWVYPLADPPLCFNPLK